MILLQCFVFFSAKVPTCSGMCVSVSTCACVCVCVFHSVASNVGSAGRGIEGGRLKRRGGGFHAVLLWEFLGRGFPSRLL